MPISGVVLVCSGEVSEVVTALREAKHVTVGPIAEAPGRIPVVVDTDTHAAHRERLRWLGDLAGVSHLELTYVDYRDDCDPRAESGARVEGSVAC